jgi:adenine phosphoribosyltransferase
VTPGPFDIDAAIRRVPDHPRAGILFYDLLPLFQDREGLASAVGRITGWGRERAVDRVVGIEARGFVLGGAIATGLGVGLSVARKRGKLPSDRVSREYELEYGTDVLEMHTDAVARGERVLVHDDLLATGGTALAVCRLVEELGGVVAGVAVVAELTFLPGRETLTGYDVMSLVTYASEAVEA